MEHNDEDADLVKQTMAEVDRYRSMDRLIPSYHNIVTIAALDVSHPRESLLPLADIVAVSPGSDSRESRSKPSSSVLPSNSASGRDERIYRD
jgi:hypothetical protein